MRPRVTVALDKLGISDSRANRVELCHASQYRCTLRSRFDAALASGSASLRADVGRCSTFV
jgi:hypothetical protein